MPGRQLFVLMRYARRTRMHKVNKFGNLSVGLEGLFSLARLKGPRSVIGVPCVRSLFIGKGHDNQADAVLVQNDPHGYQDAQAGQQMLQLN